MKIRNPNFLLVLTLLLSLGVAQCQRPPRRRMSGLTDEDWMRELQKAESETEDIIQKPQQARSLRSKDDWMTGKRLKRSQAKAKKIKDQIRKLKRRLAKVDHSKITKKFLNNIKNHEGSSRHLKRSVANTTEQNVFRNLILQKILGNNGAGVGYPSADGLGGEGSAKHVEITPKIRSLLLKNLTLGDLDLIAKKKLTVERYDRLISSTTGLESPKKKERYLNVVLKTLGNVIAGVVNTVAGLGTAVNALQNSPAGNYMGVTALGAFAGLKARKNKKFNLNKDRLLKQIEMFETVNTLIDEEKRGATKTTDYLSALVTRSKSITDNLGFRFDSKCRLFGGVMG